jgi:hypothetical protein
MPHITMGDDRGMHLETIWSVDTHQGHSLRILHRDMPVHDIEEARAKERMVGRIELHPDGLLVHRLPNGRTEAIDEGDVVIEEYTRPFEMRGEPFVPDMSTPEGRARMEAVMTDPRYHATDADYAVVDIGLKELATIPGAVGRLDSVAYDAR